MKGRLLAAFIAAVMLAACASKAPASLSPAGAKVFAANQAVLVLNVVQTSAINLNAAVPPLLSEQNTRIVGNATTAARAAIAKVPDGWRVTTTEALAQIRTQLDASGKKEMAAWLDLAASMVKEIH